MAIAACALFAFTWVFRFNTLGGSYGGFENDHFVPFAYAKQVQAGEQPLRDFTGLGLQGAWPSLTYEASAAAQRILGNNLRSEALLTVTAVAAAAAATCVAAALLAPLGWSIAGTVAAVLLQPTLYNYPKVLLLSVAAVAICVHARRRGLTTVAALAAITAIAFLFRHDYAVYVGLGASVVLAAAAGRWRRAAAHLAVYGLVTLMLLAPALLFVHRHLGLGHYLRDSVATSASEAERTELAWPSFSADDADGAPLPWTAALVARNAESWLYYVMLATPLALLAGWRRVGARARAPWVAPAVLAIGVMFVVAHWFLLRGNLAARLGEVAPLWAVLAAIWLGAAVTRVAAERTGARPLRLVLAAIVVTATGISVGAIGEVAGQLRTAGMFRTEQTVWDQSVEVWQTLGGLPDAYWAKEDAAGALAVARYVNRCTDPDDHVLVHAYQPEVLGLADRRFAGGRLNYVADLLSDEAHQREIVDHLTRQRVDLALVEARYQQVYDQDFAIVQAYLREHYVPAGVIPRDAEGRFQVLVRRGARVLSRFGPDALPCFRAGGPETAER